MNREGQQPMQSARLDPGAVAMIAPLSVPSGWFEWQQRAGQHQPEVPPRVGPVLIRICDPKGMPVQGAEVSFLSAFDLCCDFAVTDRQGRAVLTSGQSVGSETDAIVVEAEGFAPLLLPSPDLVAFDSAHPVTNTLVVKPLAGPVVDAPCWGIEAMQIDRASISMPLGTRRPRIGVIMAQTPGAHLARKAVDHIAIDQIIQRVCPEAQTFHATLSASPTVDETIAALGILAAQNVDLIVLNALPSKFSARLECCLGKLMERGILVLSPAPARGHRAGVWSGAAPVLCVAALGGRETKMRPCATATSTRVDLVAPGIGIRINNTLRSAGPLAAAHAAGFLLCLMQAEGLLVGRKSKATADAALQALGRWLLPVGTGARMPVWGGQDFLETADCP